MEIDPEGALVNGCVFIVLKPGRKDAPHCADERLVVPGSRTLSIYSQSCGACALSGFW